MKSALLSLSVFVLLSCHLQSFSQEADSIYKEKMKFFTFLEGQWEGSAEVQNRDGSISVVRQHENVEFRLKGTLLVIEGTGTDANGAVVFNALASIFYDKTADAFTMFAWKDNGQFTEASVETGGDNQFTWSFSPFPQNFIKYEVALSDEGHWTEKGFYSRDGTAWSQFFSMDLERLK